MRRAASKAFRGWLPVCRHDGFHTATTHYDHRSGVMRFVLVCDVCGTEIKDVTRVKYRPHFDRCQTPPFAA
jgi:hypothetical protein